MKVKNSKKVKTVILGRDNDICKIVKNLVKSLNTFESSPFGYNCRKVTLECCYETARRLCEIMNKDNDKTYVISVFMEEEEISMITIS